MYVVSQLTFYRTPPSSLISVQNSNSWCTLWSECPSLSFGTDGTLGWFKIMKSYQIFMELCLPMWIHIQISKMPENNLKLMFYHLLQDQQIYLFMTKKMIFWQNLDLSLNPHWGVWQLRLSSHQLICVGVICK